MKVNKAKDVIERTFWTFLNTFLGALGADELIGSISISTWHKLEVALIAAALTTLKTLAAQHAGSDDLGAAIPGGVLEEK